MNIFQPPICHSKDKNDQGKFNLTWYTGIITLVFGTLLTVLHIDENIYNLSISLFGLCFSLFALIVLFKTGKHWGIAIIIVIIGTGFIQYSIYSLLNPDRTIDIIWIMTYTLYAFYALNKFWGIFIFLVNLLGFSLYQLILTDIENFNQPIAQLLISDQIDYYANIGFGALAISFLMLRILKK